MAHLRWTPQAVEDLETIADFPMMGRIVPEIVDTAIRELLLGNYRIIYRLNGEVIEILTIYHGSRLLDPQQLHP